MYDTTTEALQDLMNRGFLIYEEIANKWCVQKIPTTLDPRVEFQIDKNTVSNKLANLDSQAAAVEMAIQLSSQESEFEYVVEVKYNEGLGPKFKTLSSVYAKSPSEAEDMARSKAESYFADKPQIKSWSSRVRPVNIVVSEL